jgi:hypothetical protein
MSRTVAAVVFTGLLAACSGQPGSSVTNAEIGNVISMSENADGNFEVQCEGGFGRLHGDKEIDTPSQLLANQLCLRRQEPMQVCRAGTYCPYDKSGRSEFVAISSLSQREKQ